jgi:hypothetical protein
MSDYDDDELQVDSSYKAFSKQDGCTRWIMYCPHCCDRHEMWELNELYYCPCTPMHKTGFPSDIIECLSDEPGKVMSRFSKMSAIIKYKLQKVLPDIVAAFENARKNKRAEKESRKAAKKEAFSDMESRIDYLEAQVQDLIRENHYLRDENNELRSSINEVNANAQNAGYAALRAARMLDRMDDNINFIAGRMV